MCWESYHGHSSAMLWEISPCCSSSQSVPIASCRVTGHNWTETGSVPSAPSPQVFTGLMRSPWDSSSEESWLSCPLPMGEVLVPPSSLCPFPELSQVFPCLPYTEEPRTGHSPAGVASPVQSRGAGPPPSICRQHFAQCSRGHPEPSLLQGHSPHSSSTLCPAGPQVLFYQAASQLGGPQHIFVYEAAPFQVQDFALLLELHEVPVEVLLDGSMTLWNVSHSSQVSVTCQAAEGPFCPITQIINGDAKQDWTQHRLLGCTSSHWLPNRLCATGHCPLGPTSPFSTHLTRHVQHRYQQLLYENLTGGCVKGLPENHVGYRVKESFAHVCIFSIPNCQTSHFSMLQFSGQFSFVDGLFEG